MDFITRLPISINSKSKSYNFILVIVNQLTKMIYYKLVKITIDISGLAEAIFNIVVWHYGLFNSIISNKDLLFTFKFWLSLCYFFGIKWKLFMAFHSQTDSQTEWQNSTIEVYLWVFINFKQNNWARLLPMAKFAYNNTKNASFCHTLFELNYGYHSWISYKKDVNLSSKSKKIFITLKNFRSGPIIKTSSLRAMLPIIKFGETTNILRSNKTGSWRQSFLGYFKFFICLESKFTS